MFQLTTGVFKPRKENLMRTQVKIQGKCFRCNSKDLYYGKVVGMSSRGNYLLCQDCGKELNFRVINHRRIKVEDDISYVEIGSSYQIAQAFKTIFKRLKDEIVF